MPDPSRTQLTLFAPASVAAGIEALRRVLDPVQASLIAAHVTLCREDELAAVPADALRARLAPGRVVTFPAAHLIRQDDGGPWRPLESFALGRRAAEGSR